jgi:hypothetical protein
LRERVEAQQTAGPLAKAKVRFGFQSGSLPNASDIMVNANRTIENGLSARTHCGLSPVWPAEILGAGDQLGSIEVGKIANLTITRGDLFDRNSRITHVFIDGKPVDLRPAPALLERRVPLKPSMGLERKPRRGENSNFEFASGRRPSNGSIQGHTWNRRDIKCLNRE